MSEHSKDDKSDLVDDLDTPEEDAENVKGGASRPRVRPDHNREGRPDANRR